jgi:hypothetical protein
MVETFTIIKTDLKPNPIQSSFSDTEGAYTFQSEYLRQISLLVKLKI